MSLSSFCNKLFKNENPEDLDIKMKFRFKDKNMEDKDLFEILLVIFMYGLMIKYFKNEDEINLEEITIEQFNDISKYLNALGIMPNLLIMEINELNNIKNNPQKLHEFYYKYKSVKNNKIYVLNFDYFYKNTKCNKAFKF
jgi:hypothetical protein